MKRIEVEQSFWKNPIFVAICAAMFAAVGNAAVTWVNGILQRNVEKDKADGEFKLERERAEASRILEVIKTGDREKSKVNLEFLLSAGLIQDKETVATLRAFLANATVNQLPNLPAESRSSSISEVPGAPPIIEPMSPELAAQCKETTLLSGSGVVGRRVRTEALGG